MSNATNYNIELRDKDGNLKDYLTPYASKVNWEWNRIGGCGKAKMTIKKGYRDIDFQAHDDIQIRVAGQVLGFDSYTKLLLHCDGYDASTSFLDATGRHTITAVGNAQLDTAQKKFGSASCLFDGTGDELELATSDDWDFGSGDFTIDLWVRWNSLATTKLYRDNDGSGNVNLTFGWQTDNKFRISYSTDGTNEVTNYVNWTASTNTWYHIAFIRNGVDFKIYVDGVCQGTLNWTGIDLWDTSTAIKIGQNMNGWIDEFRISKGIARWTANFTPPTSAYTEDTETPGSKLAYRGYIEKINPQLSSDQRITLDIMGYFGLLKNIVVHDNASTKTYENMEVSEIVNDIVDTFITPNSSITKGTIDTGNIQVDTLDFKVAVDASLKTLAELSGDIEYGVDENLVFYWRTEDTTVKHKFFVGSDIEMLERRFDWSGLINKIYFEGAEVNGVTFTATRSADDSISSFFLSERIIANSAVTTDSVADQYIGATLKQNSKPVMNLRAKIPNTNLRIEDTIPMGEVSFHDADHAQSMGKWGTSGNGGSGWVWGKAANGGSGKVWGSIYHAQINRIKYELSETSERFNIEIQLGDTILETAARLKRLELDVSSLRQRS